MARNALVTGGAGFIGSHVVERLVRDGWRVRILDDLSTGCIENLASVRTDVDIVQGDIRDLEACRRASRGIDTVFHLAAMVSVVRSVEDPLHSHGINVDGTLNVLQGAREHGVRRLVFSSSAAVYGNAEAAPTREDQPLRPQSPYATEKCAGEMYCRNFQDLYGLETVVLRYFNVFGPRQSADSGYAAVIPAFEKAIREGRAPIIFGDGGQTRDFVYVENVAQANLLAAGVPGAAGGTFNIAAGESRSLLELVDELARAHGRQLMPLFREARAGEVRHSRADISRARIQLGYAPEVGLSCGLERMIAGSREGGLALAGVA
jgi:UDP-glucose 4-epimerase